MKLHTILHITLLLSRLLQVYFIGYIFYIKSHMMFYSYVGTIRLLIGSPPLIVYDLYFSIWLFDV